MKKILMTSFIEAMPELVKRATGEEISRVAILTQIGIIKGAVDEEFTEALDSCPSLPIVRDGVITLTDVEIELFAGNILKMNSIVLSHDAILGAIPFQDTIETKEGGRK